MSGRRRGIWRRKLPSEPEVQQREDERAARAAHVDEPELHAVEIARHIENAELEPDRPRGNVERTDLRTQAVAGEVDWRELETCHCICDIVDEAEVEDGEVVHLAVAKVEHRAEYGVRGARQLKRRSHERDAQGQPEP